MTSAERGGGAFTDALSGADGTADPLVYADLGTVYGDPTAVSSPSATGPERVYAGPQESVRYEATRRVAAEHEAARQEAQRQENARQLASRQQADRDDRARRAASEAKAAARTITDRAHRMQMDQEAARRSAAEQIAAATAATGQGPRGARMPRPGGQLTPFSGAASGPEIQGWVQRAQAQAQRTASQAQRAAARARSEQFAPGSRPRSGKVGSWFVVLFFVVLVLVGTGAGRELFDVIARLFENGR